MMKRFKILSALAAVLLSACTEDEMDRINAGYSYPDLSSLNGRFMITDAIVSTGFSASSGDYAYFSSVYCEQTFGTGNREMAQAELRQLSIVSGSATFNNVWNNVYGNLLNIKYIIDKCGSGGTNDGQKDLLGMAQVLAAVNWGILTDMHGDIPCSQALRGSALMQPELDRQESVYGHIFALLDNAIDNLSEAKARGMKNVGNQDLLYGNDNGKWLAAAHAVKARYKLHMMKRDPEAAAEALTEAQAAIDSGFDGMTLDIYEGTASSMSPWAAFQQSRTSVACSTTVQSLLRQRNDPREDIYIYYYTDRVAGVDPSDPPVCAASGDGSAAGLSSPRSLSSPKWLSFSTDGSSLMYPAVPTDIVPLSETFFIMAELQARGGTDCTEALTAAIASSFRDMSRFGDIGVQASDYMASISARVEENALGEVMVQKYLSQCRDGQVETFNDIRRCKALGEEHVKLTNPCNLDGSAPRFPLRMPYGNSGVSSNPNVRKAYGDGLYIFPEPVWIYGGER